MGTLYSFFTSSIGRKLLVAITGTLLTLFLVAHLAGNLLFFAGPELINDYAAALKAQPLILWTARAGLIFVFALHLLNALVLAMHNRAARGSQYETKGYKRASGASRSMVITGLLIFAYVVYHLSHFTLGLTHPEHYALQDAAGRHDVHAMIVRGFEIPFVAWLYVAAMIAVAYHLSHGIQSALQTFGWRNEKYETSVQQASIGIAVLISLGFSTIPLAVQFGLVN